MSTAHVTVDDAPPALLRLRASSAAWIDHLPPSPRGQTVTVSFSTARANSCYQAAVAALGYRVVGCHPLTGPAGATADFADFLVPARLRTRRPAWWRTMLRRSEHAFDLAMGPVHVALRDVVDAHRAAGR